jgi:hypothetical protein
MELGRIYLGDNADCADSDADGLADVQELGGSGVCCGYDPSTPCDIGTDAGNPDSDGDGCPDGEEVGGGTDPCDASDCGCGAGICGTGSVAMLPVILLVLAYMRLAGSRARRRR